jgi:hypothetical protein
MKDQKDAEQLRAHQHEFVRTLGAAVTATLTFSDSYARNLLWCCWTALFFTNRTGRTVLEQASFFQAPVELRALRSGLAIFTRCSARRECRVSFVVPRESRLSEQLAMELCVWCDGSPFDEHYAIDLTPCRNQIEGVLSPVRVAHRMVPSDARRHEIVLLCDRICYNRGHHVDDVEVLRRDQIRDFKPLGSMRSDDSYSQRYWTVAACGTIVGFCNPVLPLTRTFPYCPVAITDACEAVGVVGDRLLQQFLMASFAEELSAPLERLCISGRIETSSVALPMVARALVVSRLYTVCGLSDRLLSVASQMLTTANGCIRGNPHEVEALLSCDLRDAIEVGACVAAMVDGDMKLSRVAARLAQVANRLLANDCPVTTWEDWFLSSPSIARQVQKETPEALVAAAKTWKLLWRVAVDLLGDDEASAKRGARLDALAPAAWDRSALLRHKAAWDTVRAERKLHRKAATAAADVLQAVFANVDRVFADEARRRETCAVDSSAPEECVAPASSAATVVVRELRERFGEEAEWHVIGSSAFSRGGKDVDLVLMVSSDSSLPDVYADAAERLRLTLQRQVSEERVNLLTGRVLGHSVDLQIVRRTFSSAGENLSRSAMAIAKLFEAGMDSSLVRAVEELHCFFDCAGLKSHIFCRVPGVAITCVAVVLGATCGSSPSAQRLPHMLRELRERLTHSIPYFDLEEVESGRRFVRTTVCRPKSPLTVRVREQNLSTRMTAACTRNLLDTVAFACSLSAGELLRPESFSRWRTREMFRAAACRPKHFSSIAKTLFAAVESLSSHPLIETLYVRECERGDVEVFVTLCHKGDEKYGFSGFQVMHCEGEYAVLRKGRMTVPLIISVGMPLDPKFTSFSRQIAVEGGCVPSAPFLTVDVRAKFSKEEWCF